MSASPSASLGCPAPTVEEYVDHNVYMTISGLIATDLVGTVLDTLLAALQEITCGSLSLVSSQAATSPCVPTDSRAVSISLLANMPRSRQDEITSASIVLEYLLENFNHTGVNTTGVCGLAAGEVSTSSDTGTTMGLAFGVVGAAAMAVFCCRRKRGSKVRLALITGEKSAFAPNTLSKHQPLQPSTFIQADQLFDWLDEDGNGAISARELSDLLGISLPEAASLVKEAHMTLYGRVPDSSRGMVRPGEITRDDFIRLMDPCKSPTPNVIVLPKEQIERYKMVFDSIDADGTGVISPDELAEAVGDDTATFKDAFVGRDQLTFPDFVALLQRSEGGRAAAAFLDLLEATGQNAALVEAIREQHRARTAVGPPKLSLPDGTMYEVAGPVPDFDYDDSEVQSSCLETPHSPVPKTPGKVSRDAAEDVWRSVCDGDELADVHEVRSAIMEAHAMGDLDLSDDAILDIACKLGESCPDGTVSADDFWAAMSAYVDAGRSDSFKALARAASGGKRQPAPIAIARPGSMRIKLHLEAEQKKAVKAEGSFDLNASRFTGLKRQGSASRRMSVSRADSFMSSGDEAVSTSVNAFPASNANVVKPTVAVVSEFDGDLNDYLGDSDDDLVAPIPMTAANRAASLRQRASLDRAQSSTSNHSEAFDFSAMVAANRSSRRIPKETPDSKASEEPKSVQRLASPPTIAKAVYMGDKLAEDLHDASLANQQMNVAKSNRRGSLADELYDASLANQQMNVTKPANRRGSLADELYDASLVSEAKMKTAGPSRRRASLADELYDAALVSEAKMQVQPGNKPAKDRPLANELFEATNLKDAMTAFSAEASDSARARAKAKGAGKRKGSVALSDELYDASMLDVAMQQFASGTVAATGRRRSVMCPTRTAQDEIAALEAQYPGINDAFQPHPTELDVYMLGPLQMRVQTIEGRPMIAVGQGFSTVENFISKRAGRIRQILESKPAARSQPVAAPALDTAKLNNLTAVAVKAVDAEVPGVFKALQAHNSKPGTFRIGTMEFTVKVEDDQVIETTSGVELEQWLGTRKMKVRRAIFSQSETPRAQSNWSEVHSPR